MVTNAPVQQVLPAQNAKLTSMSAQARHARTTDTALTKRMATNATASLLSRELTVKQVLYNFTNQ